MLLAFNSAAAVIFFFVLSGYVLGRALERDSALVPYLVRRLLRLFPAFVVMVLFAFACERLFRIDPIPSGLNPGIQRMFWPQPTWDALRDNLLLSSFKVNGPTWTLFPELMGALMLPFVVAAHVSSGKSVHVGPFTLNEMRSRLSHSASQVGCGQNMRWNPAFRAGRCMGSIRKSRSQAKVNSTTTTKAEKGNADSRRCRIRHEGAVALQRGRAE